MQAKVIQGFACFCRGVLRFSWIQASLASLRKAQGYTFSCVTKIMGFCQHDWCATYIIQPI